jgi:hypothetical protein
MSRKLRPLAALAMVALIGAGCSNGSAENGSTGTASSAGTGGNKNATDRDKAVKFAECMRENGVSDFPDPNAAGEFVYGAGVENALNVPVTAIVGKSGGGFAVEVVRDGERHELVAVEVGLFDTTAGRVEVTGDLREGDQVVVPSL